jgi:hypothetical protein
LALLDGLDGLAVLAVFGGDVLSAAAVEAVGPNCAAHRRAAAVIEGYLGWGDSLPIRESALGVTDLDLLDSHGLT